MPGNELGDRVHNFFAQDNSLQGQHHSQVVEGNWQVVNSNFGVGSQRQLDLLNSNNKNHSSQNSDIHRGEGSYHLHVTHGLNSTQSNPRPDFATNPHLNEQQHLNGFMYGNKFHQTRQNEANFLAVDTDSDQRQLITSRGLSARELQQGSEPDHQPNAVRPETSVYPLSFDLFGGQQQMSYQQFDLPQSLHPGGVASMAIVQQQIMIRKMQELQRQQQRQQLDLRQQDLVNQVSHFAKETSGSQSTLANGAPNSDTSQNPWTTELGTNWLNQGSPTVQDSPSGLGFPPNLAQTQHFMDLVPQQVSESLYGVPISSSRNLPVNQYSQTVTARSSIPQMSISSNSVQGNQHNLLPDQAGIQDEPSISRHKFQSENIFGLTSRLSPNTGIRNMGNLQQVNTMTRNTPRQDFLGRQELAVEPRTSREKPTRHVASPQNEVPLDPTEEKILYGSDDNIWAAFGKVPHMNGEADHSFNDVDISNGLPSLQSGSWSALMQSAVAETSSSYIAPQEEWSGRIFRDGSSGSQLPLMGLNQLGEKFQNELGQRTQNEMSQSCFPSLDDAGKFSNRSPPQTSVAEGSQIYGNASQRDQADRNAKTTSPTWIAGHTGSGLQSNGWNTLSAIPPGVDRVNSTHRAEKSQQNPHNSQRRAKQEVTNGSSLWKSNSIPNSSSEFGRVNSGVESPQGNQEIVNLREASVAKSCSAGTSNEASPLVHNNLLSQWKNAHPRARFQGGENLGRPLDQSSVTNQVLDSMGNFEKDEGARHELENYDGKENSSDSRLSNLSQHTSGGFRESGLSDVSDSQSFLNGKQKSTSQLSKKVPASRKFQYHPMGDVNEDVEPTDGLKQPNRVQATSQQNAYFGRLKMFGQVSRNSTVMEKGQSSELQKDTKGPDERSSHGNVSGNGPKIPVPFSRPIDTYISNNASSSSQNMLELLHKVDQSRNHGSMMQFRSSEQNASSQLPEAESDGVGLLQSSVSQGFGLQLGPPSQRLQTRDQSFSSQNGQSTFTSLYSGNAAAGKGDKGQQMVASHSNQSLPSAEETQLELKHNRSAIPGHVGNDNSHYKTLGNFNSAFLSGSPYSRSNVPNQHMTNVSRQMSMNQHIDSLRENASYTEQRSAETLLPDASGSFQQDKLGSSGSMFQQRDLNDVHERVPMATIPTGDPEQTSQKSAVPNISRQRDSAQMLHNMWTNVPTRQNNMGVQFQQASSHLDSPQPSILESSSALVMQGNLNSKGPVDGEERRLRGSSSQPVVSVNMEAVPKMRNASGKGSSTKDRLDESPANSASTPNDIEAFGHSLKSTSFSRQNYSLLNQIQPVKDKEIDPSNMVFKRIEGPDKVADFNQVGQKAKQQNENNAMVGNSLGSSTGVPSEDSNMLGFFSPADILQRKTSQQETIAAQDVSGLRDVSQNYPRNGYMTSVGVDHPQVSPQMAPSWFNQYGTFKDAQMLYDARQVIPLRPVEPPFTLKSSSGLDMLNSEEKGTAAPIVACQINNSYQNSSPSLVADHCFSALQSSQPDVAGQNLVILRTKKRKSATSELHPWHREISECSQDLWTLSMPEADWDKAANSLTEKVEDDAELIEDGPPALRSKRRLILTTYLMQQLIRPAPAAILSADACACYEIVGYTVSRIALGDACSNVSCSGRMDDSSDSMDLLVKKAKLSERNGGHHYAKATEELMGRAKKLENDFLRLDKSASILDLRVECQDLEKFSVINRFARFHGRGQTDNTETSSGDVTESTRRPTPQRYVTALPMPRSVPDRVQCISL